MSLPCKVEPLLMTLYGHGNSVTSTHFKLSEHTQDERVGECM